MSVDASLDQQQFLDMFRAGYASLARRVSVVNGLNVFPVPDGDTGTNMELSLAAGLKSMEGAAGRGFRAVLDSLSTGLLMGARGNSGVILSQLLRGFTKVNLVAETMDIGMFAQALSEGVQIAYQAVAKPVEGTILTVAREAAAAGKKAARTERNFASWLSVVVDTAQMTLDKTPTMLPVLKNAGVVDSGGQGLVFVLEGFLDFVVGRVVDSTSAGETASVPELHLDAEHHDGEFGYCTEVLIRTEDQPVRDVEQALRRQLATYGDSLLVVSAEPLVKVHVHTLHPGRVMEDALQFGPLVKIKVDNMTEQFETVHRPGVPVNDRGHEDEQYGGGNEQEPSTGADDEFGGAKGPVLVAVAAGAGIVETFQSIGVDKVIEGGQTMNPSTEEIVQAVRSALADSRQETAIILPNNKNIILAAEQAKQVLGDNVFVVPTADIPQGMAAVLAYLPGREVSDNLRRMKSAADKAVSGQIVRAVRDSFYEGLQIHEGQYLVFVKGALAAAYSTAEEAMEGAIASMWHEDAELLTVLYGRALNEEDVNVVLSVTEKWPDLAVEVQSGGQPVYDYILALE
ncbi:DAK2 domain-containing protein [Alicyclobacillus ferrooxydans]|uniref:DhaL domain-containing protein n=1 Tax=Alicyclobacillus ferrooxydans TaxID=471514 RepID=A0A0P9EPE5_9BACL|nr:DAK2 domain-containing protein [Alicyclobacillus ferrooxydans]KPV45353.1 hypothetical protein AN477_03120 [Alicyclobacillus ferrooxydans]